MTKKHLVLIGGGHAHMVTLSKLRTFLDKGCEVSVIQPSDYHYYSGMGPGMLGGTYLPEEIRFHTRRVVEAQGGRFFRDRARLIDPIEQTVLLAESGEKLHFDVLSCNAGSFVPENGIVADDTVFTAKPIERLQQARRAIMEKSRKTPLDIAIVGGGPSSLELSGNVWQLLQEHDLPCSSIRIFAGSRLMGRLPAKIGALARTILQRRKIEIIEGSYVQEAGQGEILLENGRTYRADIVFQAKGVQPSRIFADSGLPVGPDGGLLVNRCLQSTEHANIFGGGDCITFQPQPLDKVGVYAVRENPVLYHNLLASLEGRELQAFEPGGDYLLIYNLGGGVGIFCKWSLVFSGKLAFTIKDYIDRKFMKEFQAIEHTLP